MYILDNYPVIGNKEKISLEKYNKLYPSWIDVKDIPYLRQIGITPEMAAKFINEDLYKNFMSGEWFEKSSSKEGEDSFQKTMKNFVAIQIKGSITALRSNTDYIVVTDKLFEPDIENVFLKQEGDILSVSDNYRSCLEVIDYENKEEIDLYETTANVTDKKLNPYLNYNTLISSIPISKRPVMLQENKVFSAFGEEVATLNYHPDGNGLIIISFSDSVFEKKQETVVRMSIKKFENALLAKLESKSACGSYCSVILSFINATSYIFNIMYKYFYKYIVIFLMVFMALFIVFEFLKGFSNIPFSADFSFFPKSIAKKLQLMLVALTIILVPVPKLFSWTVEPILDLTMAISTSIINIGVEGGKSSCDSEAYVNSLYKDKERIQGALPPVVEKYKLKELQNEKSNTNKFNDLLDDGGDKVSIMSSKTKGQILCFMTDTTRHNGKYIMLGSMLIWDWTKIFWAKSENVFIAFILGIVIFFAYTMFNLRIAFYLIEGILQFLRLAIIWPFAVFGHVFNLTGMTVSIKSLVDMAKSFGMTMITLSVFSLFNMTFVNAFYFTNNNKGENIMQILDKAIERGDANFLIQNMNTDILYITKFLFIIYCLYYVYSQLGKFASYYGGSIGSSNSYEQVYNFLKSTVVGSASVGIEKAGDFADKRAEKKKKK